MCGRYAIAPRDRDAWASFGEVLGEHVEAALAALERRFNVAPTDQVPFIRTHPQTRAVEPLLGRWGFVPHWWKEVKPPQGSTINARHEEAATKPMWRDAWHSRRCLIPATHWYEWRKVSATSKEPFAFHMKQGEAFCFAGLYSRWTPPGSDESIYTVAILTRNAAPELAHIHDRMPIILHPAVWLSWIDPATTDSGIIGDILAKHAIIEATTYRISAKVSSPRNQGPEVLDPIV